MTQQEKRDTVIEAVAHVEVPYLNDNEDSSAKRLQNEKDFEFHALTGYFTNATMHK